MFTTQFVANGACYSFVGNPYAEGEVKKLLEAEENRRYYKNLGDVYSTRLFESSVNSKLRHLTNFGEVKKLY